MIDSLFKKVLEEYQNQKTTSFGSSPFYKIITEQIPNYLKKEISNDEKYKIYGSFGTGGWSETPWVAILNKSITDNPREGYYVVFLLDTVGKTLYLCLAVGWTQFQENFSVGQAKDYIQKYSLYFYKHLTNIPDKFTSGPIDLHAEHPLSKGYELGQIISRAYTFSDIEDGAILHDLKDMLSIYDQLAGFAGNDILNIPHDQILSGKDVDKSEKQLNAITLIQDKQAAIAELRKYINDQLPAKREVTVKKAVRIPGLAKLIKESREYRCEICKQEPFKQRNGQLFAHADHITPLGVGGLDSPDNMRCLCAQCHAIITYGSDSVVKELLSKQPGS